jgi:hypothetical protein
MIAERMGFGKSVNSGVRKSTVSISAAYTKHAVILIARTNRKINLPR